MKNSNNWIFQRISNKKQFFEFLTTFYHLQLISINANFTNTTTYVSEFGRTKPGNTNQSDTVFGCSIQSGESLETYAPSDLTYICYLVVFCELFQVPHSILIFCSFLNHFPRIVIFQFMKYLFCVTLITTLVH